MTASEATALKAATPLSESDNQVLTHVLRHVKERILDGKLPVNYTYPGPYNQGVSITVSPAVRQRLQIMGYRLTAEPNPHNPHATRYYIHW